MQKINVFSIAACLPGRAPIAVFMQAERDGLFLSPHVRLCGHSAVAHLESQLLAQRFAEACVPILQKRYGNGVTLEVCEWISSETKTLAARIRRDSNIVLKRLETGNFAPNKVP